MRTVGIGCPGSARVEGPARRVPDQGRPVLAARPATLSNDQDPADDVVVKWGERVASGESPEATTRSKRVLARQPVGAGMGFGAGSCGHRNSEMTGTAVS